MKSIIIILMAIGILADGCNSYDRKDNSKDDLPNLVELNPPGDSAVAESKLYIDSVRVATYNNTRGLLVKGSFPDGCTHLESADHRIRENGTLSITLKAWQDPSIICAQVLTPFSYFYDRIPRNQLTDRDSVIVNGQSYSIP